VQAEYPITVQAIRSQGQKARLYVYVPLPLAAAIGLEPGEQVQWTLLDRNTLQVKRYRPAPIKTVRPSRRRKAKRT
jgi:hypothetical protein